MQVFFSLPLADFPPLRGSASPTLLKKELQDLELRTELGWKRNSLRSQVCEPKIDNYVKPKPTSPSSFSCINLTPLVAENRFSFLPFVQLFGDSHRCCYPSRRPHPFFQSLVVPVPHRGDLKKQFNGQRGHNITSFRPSWLPWRTCKNGEWWDNVVSRFWSFLNTNLVGAWRVGVALLWECALFNPIQSWKDNLTLEIVGDVDGEQEVGGEA